MTKTKTFKTTQPPAYLVAGDRHGTTTGRVKHLGVLVTDPPDLTLLPSIGRWVPLCGARQGHVPLRWKFLPRDHPARNKPLCQRCVDQLQRMAADLPPT